MNPMAYRPRRVDALGTLPLAGRRLKVYGLWAEGCDPSVLRATASWRQPIERLVDAPTVPADHGLGYLIVHLANDGDYLLIGHWIDANMLRQQVYRCRIDHEGLHDVVSLAQSGVIACVWELEVMKFERDAWVRSVLAAGRLDAAAAEGYLAATFSGWV